MELAILKTLLNKEFYDSYRGVNCPHKIFSKDNGKIKTMIDEAMQKYRRDLSVEELQVIFLSADPSMTSAERQHFTGIFDKMKRTDTISHDIAQECLSKMFQKYLGGQITQLGGQYLNGMQTSLEPLRHMLEKHNDDFTPNVTVEWDDLSIEHLLDKNDLEARWRFNIPPLARKVEGVNAGHLVIIGARPNTGKTSFHASLIAGPGGFAEQGAKCIILCNEESTHRVGARYLTAASGMNLKQIKQNPKQAQQRWRRITENISIKDVTGRDMMWVESVCKTYKPDVIVLDMGDKFTHGGFTSQHEALKACAIHARMIAKEYNCVVFYMSQLSADAEGRIQLDQSMMEGSKTGKASEADLMLLISRNPVSDNSGGEDEIDDPQRHINSVKNKLTGWHGYVSVNLDVSLGRYGV